MKLAHSEVAGRQVTDAVFIDVWVEKIVLWHYR
jgi:hypothetical protein